MAKNELAQIKGLPDVEDFDAVFNFFDKNGNGKIEKNEMLAVMKKVKFMEGLDLSDPDVKKAVEELERGWDEHDTNKNGYLEKEEFKAIHEGAKDNV